MVVTDSQTGDPRYTAQDDVPDEYRAIWERFNCTCESDVLGRCVVHGVEKQSPAT